MAEIFGGPYMEKLSPELLKIAVTELHEDPLRRANDIEAIRTWIKQQPHLQIRTDDMFILRFLRAAKFSLERAKEKIDKYYTLRNALPEWFGLRSISDAKVVKLLNLGYCVPLKGHNKLGRKIVIYRSGVYDAKDFCADDIMRVTYLVIDHLLMDEATSINGMEALIDVTGATLAHITSFNLSTLKKTMAMTECTPARFKGLHFWKLPSIMETFYNIFKSVTNEKMKNRLHILGSDLQSLHAVVPVELLPEEYGGHGGQIADINDDFLKEFSKREKYFLEDSKYKVDESKRPGKPKSHEDLFGIDGSFRKLEID